MRAVSARLRVTALALGLAVMIGSLVGALSQMTAVSVADPRPSTPLPVPPLRTASPTPIPPPSDTPTPEPTRSPAPEPWLYTVAEGESLSRIAIRFGTTTEEILRLNPEYATNQDLVEVGAPVIMPCTPIAAAEDRC